MSSIQLPLDQYGPRHTRYVLRVLPALSRSYRKSIFVELHQEIIPRTPVGTLGETSDHPGLLRASLRASARKPEYANLEPIGGQPPPLPLEAERAAFQGGLSDSLFLTSDASSDGKSSYAWAVEAGSSPQARQGYFQPSIAAVGQRGSQLARVAVREVEGEVRP